MIKYILTAKSPPNLKKRKALSVATGMKGGGDSMISTVLSKWKCNTNAFFVKTTLFFPVTNYKFFLIGMFFFHTFLVKSSLLSWLIRKQLVLLNHFLRLCLFSFFTFYFFWKTGYFHDLYFCILFHLFQKLLFFW